MTQPCATDERQGQLPAASVRAAVRIPLQLPDGLWTDGEAFSFNGLADGQEHLAVGLGNHRGTDVPLVRLHSECLTGDVLGSARCDCGPQLADAVDQISRTSGYLIYLRQEGRGIGLYNKLDAYALQDQGQDTYAANESLGLPADGRDYGAAAQMLHALDVREIRLLSNNPDKQAQLARHGIVVRDQVPTGVFVTTSNTRYLQAKIDVAGHQIALRAPTEHGGGVPA
ncbi:GTP cyclohydrolase II [Catenulispora acidiphila DSM 44928]|uniref:GTP cyclohydrolase-2 n=1 Tax=Catenulispora acidiphila (strain DSM 44928 / JCM 14897 / NBRC 102108 / NRRL B-24433 / ID139908) TaxID=479433 RepID=C7QDF5_CATAD|nr:GTP cyclohydrolase II [Catenulispora acidiphila]ACU72748.1 GTP cyclohydrolase II [Catenulispora acidiphila DSM 44928]